MEQVPNISIAPSQGSIRFFTFVVLTSAILIYLVIAFFLINSSPSKKGLVERVHDSGLLDPINSQKILNGDFKHPLFPNDSNAAKRIEYGAYSTEYDYLRTRYYAGDEKALDLAKQWREMIKSQFPEMYAQSESADPKSFEIVER